MRLVRAVLLAGALLPQASGAQVAPAPERLPGSALVPDTVLAPLGGPRIVLLASPGVGVAALRLAVPLREGPTEAGAGRLLRDLALERMRSLARPVGAQVSAARTPWGLAYTAVGATADFEYLAYLLREAVAAPDVTGPGFPEARLRRQGESAEAVETPSGRVAADLRSQISPGLPPLEGTPASVQALDAARVRAVWLRSHQPTTMTLVVSAPVVPEVVLAAIRGMGAPEESAAPPPGAPAPSGPRAAAPQSLRSWYGEAWPVGDPGDPLGAVVASLVAQQLRTRSSGIEASVELWDLPDRSVLAVVGSSWAGNAQAMRRAVSGSLRAARDALEGGAVERAAAQARRDRMMAARTPAGLVAVVGRAMEANGDPLSAERDLGALLAVDAASVRDLLDRLLRQGPRTAQVRP
ncbi:MAG: peptidase M16 family protein [Longimicrobiales bacterium]